MNIECVLIPVLILSEPALHEQQFQVLGRETRPETVVVGRCDIACLLTHHYGQGIGLLADTLGSPMTKSELLGDVQVMADGKDAGSRLYLVARDDHGTIVQGTVLEEDVLYEPLADAGIEFLACAYDVHQGQVVLHDDECSHVLLAHVETRHHDGEDILTLMHHPRHAFPLVGTEEMDELPGTLMCSYAIEEVSDLLLEEHDDGNGSHTHKLVEDIAQKLHLKNLADDDPETHEDQYSIEDIHRARLLHQFIAVEQDDSYQQDVYHVLDSHF